MEITQGVIQEFNESGKAIIIADIPNINRALFRKYKNVLIGFSDGRKISAKQMRKIYVLLKYIAEWIGDTEENTKALMKIQFNMQIQSVGKHIISFRDCDMTTAREFISLLINFMIENEIYSGEPLYLLNDDIEKYIYACLINKKCCVCGNHAQLHHVERVGMGRNRDSIYQVGMAVLPLCAVHHDECHKMSQYQFNKEYHLEPLRISDKDKNIFIKKYGLSKKNFEGGDA